MRWRWLLTIGYGLCVISVGLLRSIMAHEFKPNSFWFGIVAGTIAIIAGHFLKAEKPKLGMFLATLAVVPVLAFYLHCFVTQPEKDATLRVGFVIVASIAQICVITVPRHNETQI